MPDPTPVALISGASRGIGAAAARCFAAAGYDLLLLARSQADLSALAAELAPLGRRVETLALDLADPAAIGPGLDQLCGRGLTPSVVINNAGMAYTGSLAEMPLDQWLRLMQLSREQSNSNSENNKPFKLSSNLQPMVTGV